MGIEMGTNDLGHTIYIEQSASCTDDDFFSTGVSDPLVTYSTAGQSNTMSVRCGTFVAGAESFESSHDPPIRSAGSINAFDDPNAAPNEDHCTADDRANGMCFARTAKLAGTYTISCSTNCWSVDVGEELGEAAGGIMAMIGLVLVMAVLLGVGDLLLCIACCCCCQGPDKPSGPP